MYAYVGEPPKGKWEHPGLRGVFLRKFAQEGMPPEGCRALRKKLKFLYDARSDADYSLTEIDEDTAKSSIQIAQEVIKIVKEALRK